MPERSQRFSRTGLPSTGPHEQSVFASGAVASVATIGAFSRAAAMVRWQCGADGLVELGPLLRAQPHAWAVIHQTVTHVEEELTLPLAEVATNKRSLDTGHQIVVRPHQDSPTRPHDIGQPLMCE